MPRLPVHGISQDAAAATREFAKTFGLTFPMLLDSAGAHFPASAAWRITNVPSLFPITADRPME